MGLAYAFQRAYVSAFLTEQVLSQEEQPEKECLRQVCAESPSFHLGEVFNPGCRALGSALMLSILKVGLGSRRSGRTSRSEGSARSKSVGAKLCLMPPVFSHPLAEQSL